MNKPCRPEWTRQARETSQRLIQLALDEDLAGFVDVTSCALIPPNAMAVADLVSRQSGVLCGVEVCRMIIEEYASDLVLELHGADGDSLRPGSRIGTIHGQARQILLYERTLLNFLGRLSGVSTLTAEFVARLSTPRACILDTRKTTPGWRSLEKYAVCCGGGQNHRWGLFDAILIKDNHLAMLKRSPGDADPAAAVEAARQWLQGTPAIPDTLRGMTVEIEVDTIAQFEKVCAAAPDVVLLDNMSVEQIRHCVAYRDQHAPPVRLEVSGGVHLGTIDSIAKTGVDRISVGAITHSAPNFDIGLDWRDDANGQADWES